MESLLNRRQKICYAVGHVLNDVCASIWFTYTIVFFHLVLQFDAKRAGVILLIGQLADAFATPVIGYHSDGQANVWLCKMGRRKGWHLFGSICVLATYPMIFLPCVNCAHTSLDAQIVYYSAFVIIFQIGWASVQISHLALIPDLTSNEHTRTFLTSIRSSFTVLANILVYLIAWFVLHINRDADPSEQIGPKDAFSFQELVLICIGVGFITSVIFHVGVTEKRNPAVLASNTRLVPQLSLSEYLRDPKLYQVAIVYMSSRLFVNLGQVYIPLYLHETLVQNAEKLAIIPLVMYISSLQATFAVAFMNKHMGRPFSFFVGSVIGLCGCIWIGFGNGLYYNEYEIYIVAVLLGVGGSIMLVTSLGITADLIGLNTDSGAFIYGCMSFSDKLANGAAVIIIQSIKCTSGCPNYYRDVLAFVCGGTAIFGILPLFSLRFLSLRYVTRNPSDDMHEQIVQ